MLKVKTIFSVKKRWQCGAILREKIGRNPLRISFPLVVVNSQGTVEIWYRRFKGTRSEKGQWQCLRATLLNIKIIILLTDRKPLFIYWYKINLKTK